jgi:hypothetical protein
MVTELPTINLKTRIITFDDRLQQVRVVEKTKSGRPGAIRFLNYHDDDGFRYLKKYRKNWIEVIRF